MSVDGGDGSLETSRHTLIGFQLSAAIDRSSRKRLHLCAEVIAARGKK